MQATLAGLGEHNTHRITDDDDDEDDDDDDADDDDDDDSDDDDDDHDGDDIYCDAKQLMMMIVWIIPCDHDGTNGDNGCSRLRARF